MEIIQEATNGTYKIIGDKMRQDPTLVFSEQAQIINFVLNRDGIYPGVYSL